jgi:hypothetical protein
LFTHVISSNEAPRMLPMVQQHFWLVLFAYWGLHARAGKLREADGEASAGPYHMVVTNGVINSVTGCWRSAGLVLGAVAG